MSLGGKSVALAVVCCLAQAPADRRDPCDVSEDAKQMALRVGMVLMEAVGEHGNKLMPETQALILAVSKVLPPPECLGRER